MLKIVKSLFVVFLVAVAASFATYSYFKKTTRVLGEADQTPENAMSYQLATVSANGYYGFPLSFTNIVPGGYYSKDVGIQYTGSTIGDIYFGATHGNAKDDIVSILQVRLERIDQNGNPIGWVTGWMPATNVFGSWTKLADDMNQNEWARYRIHIYVDSNAGNNYQGDVANNGVLIYAVQDGFGPPATPPYQYNPQGE